MSDLNNRKTVLISKKLDPDKYCKENGYKRISRVTYLEDGYFQKFVVEPARNTHILK